MTGATGNIYVGLHDFEEMGFTMNLLRSDDLFADIGANIGFYTILASAVAGADTISFESVPSTFKHLENNIYANSILKKVKAINLGLGEEKGILNFSSSLDTVNHVLSSEEKYKSCIENEVGILDDFSVEKTPIIIKIDVVRFEFQV